MTIDVADEERHDEREEEEQRTDEHQDARPDGEPGQGLEDGEAALARREAQSVVRDQRNSICLDCPVKPNRSVISQPNGRSWRTRSSRRLARAAALVGRQRRIAVGVDRLVHGVAVMGLVVPGDPQPRRQRERQKAEPADQVAQPRAHDRAVQRLVADEGGAGEAVADDERRRAAPPTSRPSGSRWRRCRRR